MGQQNAAQGIIDTIGKWKSWASGKEEKKPDPPKKDPSWHAEMVKRANDEFRRRAEAKQQDKPKDIEKATPTRKTARRKNARKR